MCSMLLTTGKAKFYVYFATVEKTINLSKSSQSLVYLSAAGSLYVISLGCWFNRAGCEIINIPDAHIEIRAKKQKLRFCVCVLPPSR